MGTGCYIDFCTFKNISDVVTLLKLSLLRQLIHFSFLMYMG